MAERVPEGAGSPAVNAPPLAAEAASGDLSVMFPDASVVIDGRAITIREYRFGESQQVLAVAGPLIDSIAHSAESELPTWAMVRRHLIAHREIVLEISAIAGDVEPSWIAALSRAQGELFQQIWFSVNSRFFMQEVALVMVERRRTERQSGGLRSSSPSPVPGSAT